MITFLEPAAPLPDDLWEISEADLIRIKSAIEKTLPILIEYANDVGDDHSSGLCCCDVLVVINEWKNIQAEVIPLG